MGTHPVRSGVGPFASAHVPVDSGAPTRGDGVDDTYYSGQLDDLSVVIVACGIVTIDDLPIDQRGPVANLAVVENRAGAWP